MIEARDASERYLTTYRSYARMATRRRAAPLRQAQTVFDRVSRELAEAEAEQVRAQADLPGSRETLAGLRGDASRLEARRQALQDDPAARSARELRRAAEEADQAAARRGEAQSAADRLERRVADLGARLAEAEAEAAEAESAVGARRTEAAGHAGQAGIAAALEDVLAETDAASRADSLAARRQKAIARVRGLLRRWERARDALAEARAHTEQLVSEHAEATARRDAARARLAAAAAAYTRAVREHVAAATELALPDSAGALAALDGWLQTVSGANPLEPAVNAAGRDAARRIERATADASARHADGRATVDGLEREIQDLESGVAPEPPAPYTRAEGTRERRPGAPLWQLVDFRAGLAPDVRAGLEAALEAAGILDGWVTSVGELLDAHTEDVLVAPPAGEAVDRPLADALVPAPGGGVSEAQLHRLLGAIGLGECEAPVWVAGDGRFRNGVLRGAWHKPAAEYIGHAAREDARRARLAELQTRLAAARAEVAATEERLAELASRRARLERELAELAAAGVPLRHHGDFDWSGLAIGNLLHRRLPVQPVRFDRDAYLRAVAAHPHAGRLTGSPVAATWDRGLSAAMHQSGRRIEEELVAGGLLESLG